MTIRWQLEISKLESTEDVEDLTQTLRNIVEDVFSSELVSLSEPMMIEE